MATGAPELTPLGQAPPASLTTTSSREMGRKEPSMTQTATSDNGNGAAHRPSSGRRAMAPITSLESLVGAHPDALRDIYGAGSAADPSELQGQPRGLLLGVELLAPVYALTRPLVRTVAHHLLPWRGKVFESGGTAGLNRVFRWRLFRFHCEVADSELDGRPTLVLRYDGLENPWPISRVVDELRLVGDGVAIGPVSVIIRSAPKLLGWWGLSTQR
ncbi:MAG: hypothetical protein DRI90_13780 [Deltaproteobacteria bacterium]|nr:MAG: hypothetical protein DRI90_13780 [Deltaproteobacteria bacterium]